MGSPALLLAILLVFSGTLCPSDAGSISESLMSKLSDGSSQDAIIELPSVFSSAFNNPLLSMFSGAMKTTMMTNLLKQMTTASQGPFMEVLNRLGASEAATPFWMSNDISLKNVKLPLLQSLAVVPGPFKIREQAKVKVNPVISSRPVRDIKANADTVQWGVKKIEAPVVWKKTKGEGVTVINIDTGVKGDHESLSSNFGGAWFDPIYGDEDPTDYNGHGTHTMGSICGTMYGIGVAPGATWGACRGLDAEGSGTESSLKQCAQWVQEQRPAVVSNSWGGGQGQAWFNDIINTWAASNIVPVFSIGNSGPKCKTANSPGDQPNVFSVGSTKEDDTMSSFSSRGVSKGNGMKPEVSAPGDMIVSAGIRKTNEYVYMSGTSMACPHVAGAVALIRSASPNLSVKSVLQKLTDTVDKPAVTKADQSCGSDPKGLYRNNAFGYGRINVRKAMNL